MQPDDPRHGTYAGVQQHIRDGEARDLCPPCLDAKRRYHRRTAKAKRMGKPRSVPTGPITRRIRDACAAGMTVREFAKLSGLAESTVQELKTKPRALVNIKTAHAILGTPVSHDPCAKISNIGAIRRIDALARLGWGHRAIAEAATEAGHPLRAETIRNMNHRNSGRCEVRTHLAIAAAYNALSMKLAPPSSAATQVRNRASARAALPPLAWDNIDDPGERPHSGTNRIPRDDHDPVAIDRRLAGDRTIQLSPADAAEALRIWLRRGGSLMGFQRVTGLNPDRYKRKLEEAS